MPWAGPGLRLALEVGVDSIEHGTYLNEDPDLIPMMVEKGIFYVPTLLVYVYHRENVQDSRQRTGAGAIFAPPRQHPARRWTRALRLSRAPMPVDGGTRPTPESCAAWLKRRGCRPCRLWLPPRARQPTVWDRRTTWGPSARASSQTWWRWMATLFEDVTCLLDKQRIKLVMKGGQEFVNAL